MTGASVPQRVNDFVTSKYPHVVCDPCIVDALGLTQQAHAAQITGALGTTSDFVRERGTCSLCKNNRVVIRATRP